TAVIAKLQDIQNNRSTWQQSGSVLGDLDTLMALMANTPGDAKHRILDSVKAQIEEQLKYRPDVASVLTDLDAIKNLKGGPADATAFHDFNVLQIAFEDVWVHAFDQKFKQNVEQLYTSTIKLYADAGIEAPPLDALSDVDQLKKFLYTTQDEIRDNFSNA